MDIVNLLVIIVLFVFVNLGLKGFFVWLKVSFDIIII